MRRTETRSRTHVLVAVRCLTDLHQTWHQWRRYGAPWGELRLLPLSVNSGIFHVSWKLKTTKSCRFSQQKNKPMNDLPASLWKIIRNVCRIKFFLCNRRQCTWIGNIARYLLSLLVASYEAVLLAISLLAIQFSRIYIPVSSRCSLWPDAVRQLPHPSIPHSSYVTAWRIIRRGKN